MKTPSMMVLALIFAGLARAQDWSVARLEHSPRHLEWTNLSRGDRNVQAFVAYPEVKDKATAVVVIHEIFGLSDWVRGVTDQLAEHGYLAIAPDLLSGMGPKGGGTAEMGGVEAVRKAISLLPPDQVTGDLKAVIDYVAHLPACNGKVVVAGFCWGGGQSFRLATNQSGLKASFVFYGPGPTASADVARIACPVYGFYGQNDARITSTVESTAALMKLGSKAYEPVIYDGAGHGFMRAGEAPDASEANRKAKDGAWKRWLEILGKI